MPTLDGVEQDLGSLLNAFEEGVVFRGAGCGTFVRVMTENFFAMSRFDLRFCGAISIAREAEDGVVILTLWIDR